MVMSEWSLVGFNYGFRVYVNSSTSYKNHQRKWRYGGDSEITLMRWWVRSSPQGSHLRWNESWWLLFCTRKLLPLWGANSTDEYRTTLIYTFCRGTCRQGKNQILAVDREIVKMGYEVQNILGWKASVPFRGWYELAYPSDLIRDGAGANTDILTGYW